MSIVTVKVDRNLKVWRCAALDDELGSPRLAAAHVERVDAEHVRVTCANGFALASVVYGAEVPGDFTFADVPAELLKRVSDAVSAMPECSNCGEGDQFIPPFASLSIDTEMEIAEVTDGRITFRGGFVAEGRPFPDWRALVRKLVGEWQAERSTSGITLDPELLAKAAEAIGQKFMAPMRLPSQPSASALLFGEGDSFALVMPMSSTVDIPTRVRALAELAVEFEVIAHD